MTLTPLPPPSARSTVDTTRPDDRPGTRSDGAEVRRIPQGGLPPATCNGFLAHADGVRPRLSRATPPSRPVPGITPRPALRRRRPHPHQPLLPSSPWKAGTAPPTAAPVRPDPAALDQFRPLRRQAHLGRRGRRRPPRRPRQPPASSCLDERTMPDIAALREILLVAACTRPPATPPGRSSSASSSPIPAASAAPSPARGLQPAHPLSTTLTSTSRFGLAAPPSHVMTDDEIDRLIAGLPSLAAQPRPTLRLRLRRHQALPRLPRPRVPQRLRPPRPLRRQPREPHPLPARDHRRHPRQSPRSRDRRPPQRRRPRPLPTRPGSSPPPETLGPGAPEPHAPSRMTSVFGANASSTPPSTDIAPAIAFCDRHGRSSASRLLSVTAGSPYYNPAHQPPRPLPARPTATARPEDPLVGVLRLLRGHPRRSSSTSPP